MELKKLWETQKEFFAAKRGRGLLLLLGIAGILLIFLSELIPGQEQKAAVSATEDLEVYVEKLEGRLLETVTLVEGVGEVKIMLTLESGVETVYASTEKNTQSSTGTTSGSDVSNQSSYENEVVLVDDGSGRQALVQTALEPEIKGVAVVCQGGDDIAVIKRVTDVVSVVLGIPTSRICVTKMM